MALDILSEPSKPGDADYRRVVPVHFVQGGSYYHTPMTLTRAEIDAVRKPLEAAGYAPANQDDPVAQANEENVLERYRFFNGYEGNSSTAQPRGTPLRRPPSPTRRTSTRT